MKETRKQTSRGRGGKKLKIKRKKNPNGGERRRKQMGFHQMATKFSHIS
jgi:hypothetical protein